MPFFWVIPQSKGYHCHDLVTKHLYTSRHVLFNKSKFPFSTIPSSNFVSPSSFSFLVSGPLWLSNLLYLHSANQPSLLGSYTPPTTSTQPDLTSLPTITELPIVLFPNSHPHDNPTFVVPDFAVTNSAVPDSIVIDSIVPNFAVPTSTSTLDLIPISSSINTIQNQHPIQTRSKVVFVRF